MSTVRLGVRAEPRSPRTPSTIQNFTSYLSGISSYVSQNLHGGEGTAEAVGAHDTIDTQEHLLCAKFARPDWQIANVGTNSGGGNQGGVEIVKSCLILGYEHGFQIWNITDAHSIREIVSVRDEFDGAVIGIEPIIESGRITPEEAAHDRFREDRPLVALNIRSFGHDRQKQRCSILLYSLRQLKVCGTIKLDGCTSAVVRSNGRVIAVGTSSNQIHLYSVRTLKLIALFTDVKASSSTQLPVFDLGPRFIAYATTANPPSTQARSEIDDDLELQNDDDLDADDAGVRGSGGVSSRGGSRINRDQIGKVAEKVAKELFGGVKAIGGLGYHALSSYFASGGDKGSAEGQGGEQWAATSPPSMARAPSNQLKKPGGDGVVMARHISPASLTAPSKLDVSEFPVVAHWKPHANPISVICFNQSGTLIVTASSLANNFYIWETPSLRSGGGLVRLSSTSLNNGGTDVSRLRLPKCVYRLERGFTAATIEDVAFSVDSKWVAVSTGRGTTHVYQIDPLPGAGSRKQNGLNAGILSREEGGDGGGGGEGDASRGVGGGLGGDVISLYPITRIKQHVQLERRGVDGRSGTNAGGLASGEYEDEWNWNGGSSRRGSRVAGAPSEVGGSVQSAGTVRAPMLVFFLLEKAGANVAKNKMKKGGSAAPPNIGRGRTTSTSSGGAENPGYLSTLSGMSPNHDGMALGSPPRSTYISGSVPGSTGNSLGGSYGTSASGGGVASTTSGTEGGSIRLYRQRVLSFHPNGTLSMHCVDVQLTEERSILSTTMAAGSATLGAAAAVVASTAMAVSGTSVSHSSVSPGRSNRLSQQGSATDPGISIAALLERYTPTDLLACVFPVLSGGGGRRVVGGRSNGMMTGGLAAVVREHVKVSAMDSVVWGVRREADWEEVRVSVGQMRRRYPVYQHPSTTLRNATSMPAILGEDADVINLEAAGGGTPTQARVSGTGNAGVETRWLRNIEILPSEHGAGFWWGTHADQFVFETYIGAGEVSGEESGGGMREADEESLAASVPRDGDSDGASAAGGGQSMMFAMSGVGHRGVGAADFSDLPPTVRLRIRREAPQPYGEDMPSGGFPLLETSGMDTVAGLVEAMHSRLELDHRGSRGHTHPDDLTFEDDDGFYVPGPGGLPAPQGSLHNAQQQGKSGITNMWKKLFDGGKGAVGGGGGQQGGGLNAPAYSADDFMHFDDDDEEDLDVGNARLGPPVLGSGMTPLITAKVPSSGGGTYGHRGAVDVDQEHSDRTDEDEEDEGEMGESGGSATEDDATTTEDADGGGWLGGFLDYRRQQQQTQQQNHLQLEIRMAAESLIVEGKGDGGGVDGIGVGEEIGSEG
ncbi:hypothetical protein BJ742DRAFT_771945 [Cladochytrium replicatum]|nr:hypothetical protein BJ742DRAFT_771945 [Cladochytrium replicatum]